MRMCSMRPRLDDGRAGDDALERGVELRQGGFGEEAQAAEVDGEDRDVDPGKRDPPGRGEERAVAAEHDDQVDFGRAVRRR